jgi:hypothetical protein
LFGRAQVLVAQLEALLRANFCSISGIEVVFDDAGKGFVIDVNTCANRASPTSC